MTAILVYIVVNLFLYGVIEGTSPAHEGRDAALKATMDTMIAAVALLPLLIVTAFWSKGDHD